MKWALLDSSGLVIETTVIDPAERYPADFHWMVCDDDVLHDWRWDGEAWTAPEIPAAPSLDQVKALLRAQIDAAAEAERLKYITTGAGQAMTYSQKAAEAVMLEDDPDPQPSAYPMLSAEVGITAPTLAEVGAVVRQAHGQWILIGAAIEAARLAAKKAVTDAATADAAHSAAQVIWPA